ncbi:MAG: helix-turn-helix domain-containing protein [Hyphomicrobiales bacterium]
MTKIQEYVLLVDRNTVGDLQPEDFAHLETVFDLLPKIIFYVKDHKRRWITCNQAALTLLRKKCLTEIAGATEENFFPAAIAKAIKEDDLKIIESGERIIDRVEVITDEQGRLIWVMTNKIPILNKEGIVLGIAGITQILDVNAQLPAGFDGLKVVIKKIDQSVEQMPTIPELAALANMSESHFRRRFKQCFGIAPQDFIMKQKLHHAAKLLAKSDMSIAEIALACGFGDQSYFIRQFGRYFGDTPGKHRLKWQ